MVLMLRPPIASGGASGGDDAQGRLAVRRAAVPLFSQYGYAATSVDEVAAAAGVSRRTFFRLFAGKHEILSSDHDVFVSETADHLHRHESDRTIHRAASALSLVLDGFLAVPEDSRERYRLTRSHPVLRAEELRWVARYQRIVALFLSEYDDGSVSMAAEVSAAALVAAHNKALRGWLRGDGEPQPTAHFGEAVAVIARQSAAPGGTRRIAVIETPLSIDEIAHRLR